MQPTTAKRSEAAVTNLALEVFDLIDRIGGNYRIEDGIVYARLPDGSCWDFTIPQECDAAPCERILRGPNGRYKHG